SKYNQSRFSDQASRTIFVDSMAEWWELLEEYLDQKMPNTTQQEKAAALKVKPQSLSQWFNGEVQKLPSSLISKLIDMEPSFDANYFFRDDWPAEIKTPPHQNGTGANVDDTV